MSSKHLPPQLCICHWRLSKTYRTLPLPHSTDRLHPALTLTFVLSLTAKNSNLPMNNWQSHCKKPSLCPSSPMTYPLIPPALLALTSSSLIGTFKSASTMTNKFGATTTSSITLLLCLTHYNALHSLNPILDSANLPTTSNLTNFLPTHPILDHCFLTGPLPAPFNKAS